MDHPVFLVVVVDSAIGKLQELVGESGGIGCGYVLSLLLFQYLQDLLFLKLVIPLLKLLIERDPDDVIYSVGQL